MDRRRVTRRTFLKVSAVAGVTALLVACGKRKPISPTSATEPTLQSTAITEPTLQPKHPIPQSTPLPGPKLPLNWTRGEVPRERTLICSTFIIGNGPICNPLNDNYLPISGECLLLEPCAYYSALADKEILWLAENYHYENNGAALVIQFRRGIEWSDGIPFTAGDMLYAIQALLRVDELATDPSFRHAAEIRQEVESVEMVDDYTLRIRFKQANWRFFFNRLTFRFFQGLPSVIVPAHLFEKLNDSELSSYNFCDPRINLPVVTGPYMMVQTDQAYFKSFNYTPINQFDLRPEWWAVKVGLVEKMPDVERVLAVQYPDGQDIQIAQFIKNLVDFSTGYTFADLQKLQAKTDRFSTWSGDKPPYGYPLPDIRCLYFNCQKPPFNDPRLRWAVAYAIDQESIIKDLDEGTEPVSKSPFPNFPAFQRWLEGIEDLSAEYNFLLYNPQQSMKLMQAAGFQRDTNGFWADVNGIRPNMSLYNYGGIYNDMAKHVARQLNMNGFACEVKTPDDAYQVMLDGRAPLFLEWLQVGTCDPYEWFEVYHDPVNATSVEPEAPNIGRWYNIEFAAIVDQMRLLSPDHPNTAPLFRKAMEIWYRDLPFIPLNQIYYRLPYNTTYWRNWPTVDNPYIEPGLVYFTLLQMVINLQPPI